MFVHVSAVKNFNVGSIVASQWYLWFNPEDSSWLEIGGREGKKVVKRTKLEMIGFNRFKVFEYKANYFQYSCWFLVVCNCLKDSPQPPGKETAAGHENI